MASPVASRRPRRSNRRYLARVLAHRLTLGPILALLVVAAAWLDERLAAVAAPAWWPPSYAEDGSLPPALIVAPAVIAIALLATRELTRICRLKGLGGAGWLNAAAALAPLLAITLASESGAEALATAGVVVLLLAFGQAAWDRDPAGAAAGAGAALLSFAYLGLLPSFLILIRFEQSAWTLIVVLAAVKSCDIGAYFAGRALGRRKLIVWLSPGKTWEGLIGGVVTSALVGAVAGAVASTESGAAVLRLDLDVWSGLVLGSSLGLIGQAGDLIASLLKRDAGVKDASRMLPGFGGVLDVLDSPLLAAPVAFWTLRLLQA